MRNEVTGFRIELNQELQRTIEISMLLNSINYFLDCVYILYRENIFYLVVIHNNRLLKEGIYKTFKGARIAFSNSFRNRHIKGSARAVWTHFYEPDSDWLHKKLPPQHLPALEKHKKACM
jgi:hypothetical protein